DEAARAWQARSGQQVIVVYAGSATLARQIDQGAPAQLYLSADRDWMDWLQRRGRIDPASRADLLGNRLVLVAGARDAAPAARVAAALPARLGPGHGRLAVADVDSVPAGR